MESMKHKLGTLLLVLCLIAAAGAVWYFVAATPGAGPTDGTLVENVCEVEMGLS